jgi:NADH-quinone oxidoreductase subunit E
MDNGRIDEIIADNGGKASEIIKILLDIQHESGWLSKEIMEAVSVKLDVPYGKVHQTATFYKAYRVLPPGKHVVHVCKGTACQTRGAQRVVNAMQDQLGLRPGETDLEAKFSLVTSNCLGRCALGPVVDIDGKTYPKMTPEDTKDALKNYE